MTIGRFLKKSTMGIAGEKAVAASQEIVFGAKKSPAGEKPAGPILTQ
jgi:hypothetical protein